MLISPLSYTMDKNYQQLSPLFPKEFSKTDKDEINALFIQPSEEYRKKVYNSLKKKYTSSPAEKTSHQANCLLKVEIAKEYQRLERIKKQEEKAQKILQQKLEEAHQKKIIEEKRQAAYLIETQKLQQQRDALRKKIMTTEKANAQLKQKNTSLSQKKELSPAKLQLDGQRKLQKQFSVNNKPLLLQELIRLCDDIWHQNHPNNKLTGPYFDDKTHRLFGSVDQHWSYDFSPCTNILLIKNEPHTVPTSIEPCPDNCLYYS